MLFSCLTDIRNLSRVSALIEIDIYRFLYILKQSFKLQKYYIQNFDRLEARAELSNNLDFNNYKIIQLYSNLDLLYCTFCCYYTNWKKINQIILLSGKNILCLQYISIVEKRRAREARTNIYINSLQLNIVFLYDVNNLLSEQKTELIN